MRIHYLQHVPFEGLASIETWAKFNGHILSSTQLYQEEPLPKVEAFDFLVILGGPMNIYEENKYPWLLREKKFIRQAIQNDKIVLGICLGAQLIADVLWAKVSANTEPEIGWFPIELMPEAQAFPIFSDFPNPLTVFHWHGDTFEIPQGATCIAKSDGCHSQAFMYNQKVIGLQFHLESTKASVQRLIENGADQLVEGRYIQKSKEILSSEDNFKKINDAMNSLLNRLVKN